MLQEPVLLLGQQTKNEHFFGPETKYEYQDIINKAASYVMTFLDNKKFYSGEKTRTLRHLPEIKIDDQHPQSIDDTLEQIGTVFLDHTIAYHHPNYVSHLNCPILLSSLAGELIAASVNTAIETWDQSTSGTFIEQEVIRWICSKMNFPESSADGIFTSGGTQSNFMALLMARDHAAYEGYGLNLKENGWSDIVSRFRIFCSEKAHFSIKKNAALLGMGYNAVVPVKADNLMKMDSRALSTAIDIERAKGNIPIAVVATMGTTDFGSFDPLQDIADIADRHDLWLHVDGAYGGCYVLTNTHKHLLKDVYRADSVTIDFHKSLFQPVCSSAFLLKDRKHFRYVSHFADYLNPLDGRNEEQPDLIEKSVQTTRRFDALKLWFSLKVTGSKVLASSLEKVHFLALDTYRLLVDNPCFEVAHKPELSTLVFRYITQSTDEDHILDTLNKHIRSSLFNSGQAAVASTRHNGRVYLKFTLLNPNTTINDMRAIIEKIKNAGMLYTNKLIVTQ